MFKKIIVSVLLFGSMNLLAHEGHDVAVGSLKSNHGGVVKAGKDINLEFVVSGDEVKFYPISHDGKDLAANDVKLTATSKLPKGKAAALNLETKDGFYMAKVDFKDAYRIELLVNADNKGKKSTFKFQVEK